MVCSWVVITWLSSDAGCITCIINSPPKVLSPCFKLSDVNFTIIENHQISWKLIGNHWWTCGMQLIYKMSWVVEYMAIEKTNHYHQNSRNVTRCVQWQCSLTSPDQIHNKWWILRKYRETLCKYSEMVKNYKEYSEPPKQFISLLGDGCIQLDCWPPHPRAQSHYPPHKDSLP